MSSPSDYSEMRILFCSAEVSPFAKVGGLADVAGSLPKALSKMGHQVVVCMPAYGMAFDGIDPKMIEKKSGIHVQLNPIQGVMADVYRVKFPEYELWLIDGEERFKRVKESADVYSFSRDDYLFFSKACLRCAEALGWMPDVVHAHDWHMGFVPVLMREVNTLAWNQTGSVFTIHNIAYQGEFGFDTLDAIGMPHDRFTWDKLETFGGVNFLKSGCTYADQVNTVSPTYANEITTPEYGYRLNGLMTYLRAQHRLRGILNGIDIQVHDPATDRSLPAHFDSEKLEGKKKCRTALAQELNLKIADNKPIGAMICRLSEQKGFDLLMQGMPRMMDLGMGVVVLALGNQTEAAQLKAIEAKYPNQLRFVNAFDAELAQRIYGGADIFLMPSAFEPCGLGQMFAMRYGTVPVVRYTGGLADTVFDGINGFVFGSRLTKEFVGAVERAVALFDKPDLWKRLVYAGMTQDFSWDKSAKEYVEMYREACESRMRLTA